MSNSLWDFSCQIYGDPSVEKACLVLQERFQWNIPLLFFCCWAGQNYGALSPQQIQAARAFAVAFSRKSTEPLRSLRQSMKTSFEGPWPTAREEWESFREKVKSLELESERLLLQGLEASVVELDLVNGAFDQVFSNIVNGFDLQVEQTNFLNVLVQALGYEGRYEELIIKINHTHSL